MFSPAPTDFKQEIKKPTEPTKTIKLVITDKKGTPVTSVHIGDPLLLTITGPGNILYCYMVYADTKIDSYIIVMIPNHINYWVCNNLRNTMVATCCAGSDYSS